ncbi:hypothetical protein [Methylomarinovum caldicuralii]|nr:hypothetical protein [Methylomarinovum caldicuralii]
MQTAIKNLPPPRKPLCFRSDERYFCRKRNCPLRRECLRLVAVWRR